ncbi:hypothetical protein LJR230_001445 [Trinickia sp. LjRoot230]|uniref:DUF6708 domain-containing protein n=1 Tax=Trinickia sp. LjRoot230 TaxID=3342288 RepID=UPI003ECFF0DD
MVFDGLSWYKLNRPLTDVEASAQLHVDKACADGAKSVGTVFAATDTCLEVCDGLYREKGWGLLAFLTAGLMALGAAGMCLWMMIYVPPAVQAKREAWILYWGLTPLVLILIGLFSITVHGFLVDCFNYTRKPIRFNRADRTIYAFRHNGPGGVLSVSWRNAFFYVERKPKAGLGGTAPRIVRCLVLNDKGLVIDTFSIGKRVVLAFDENSSAGQQVMEELYQDFEYYRRFMEEGPSSVPPVAELLTTDVSFRNSLRMQFEDVPDILNSGHPLLWLLLAITALPSLIQATVHYLAQLTCREPVWPDAVEQACNARLPPAEGLAS